MAPCPTYMDSRGNAGFRKPPSSHLSSADACEHDEHRCICCRGGENIRRFHCGPPRHHDAEDEDEDARSDQALGE